MRIGDVAIIDHADLDRVSAEELVASGVRAVVNVAASTSGRFPNPGPLELVRAGVRLVDVAGAELFDEVSDGETVSVRGGGVWRNGNCLAVGVELDEHTLVTALGEQEAVSRTRSRPLPTTRCATCGTKAAAHRAGSSSRRSRRGSATVMRSSSSAAPATSGISASCGRTSATSSRCSWRSTGEPTHCSRSGLKPHVIVGDFDSVSDAALRGGAELLVHAYADGRAPGSERLHALGLAFHTVSAPGISEDIALQLAHQRGAELIVAVGTHFNLVEFMERNRAGMASTFVTRLKVGEVLVDAKGVSRLVSRRVGVWPLAAFTAAGAAAIVVAVLVSPALRNTIELLTRSLGNAVGL